METSKYICAVNLPTHGEKGRTFSRRSVWFGFLVLAGLGTLIFLLGGCGSDSKPKNEKGAASTTAKKALPAVPLVIPGEAGKMGQAKKAPDSRRTGPFGGMSPSELEAKAAESREDLKKAQEKNRHSVVIGGMTQQELEAKAEESRKKLKSIKGGGEVFPGITQEELERMAAQGQKRGPRPVHEMFPGATQEQLDAAARSKPELREMFPPSGGK